MPSTGRSGIWWRLCIAVCLIALCPLLPRLWRATVKMNRLADLPAVQPRDDLSRASPPSTLVAITRSVSPEAKPPDLPVEADHESVEADRHVAVRSTIVVPSLSLDAPVPPSSSEKTAAQTEKAAPQEVPEEPSKPQPSAAPPGDLALADTARRSAVEVLQERSFETQPAALVAQLEALAANDACRDWAEAVLESIRRIDLTVSSLASAESADILGRLRSQADEVQDRAAQLPPAEGRSDLLRVGYALSRRLAIWGPIRKISAQPDVGVADTALKPRDMILRVDAAGTALGDSTEAASWRTFLQLDELRSATSAAEADDLSERRTLARRVLARIDSARISADQRRVLQREPLAALAAALRHWAAPEVDYQKLLANVERYEQSQDLADARLLAEQCRLLGWAANKEMSRLSEWLASHYRNANVRIAISSQLINRLLPQLQPATEDVDDEILGAQVLGQSSTTTELFVRLLPDPRGIRIVLEASGTVTSETTASKGPAVFYSDGFSDYSTRKLVLVDPQGIRTRKAVAKVSSRAELLDVETDYDNLPVIGRLAREVARSQHDGQEFEAQLEVEDKISRRVRRRFDREVESRIAENQRRLQTRLVAPLEKLNLVPTVIELKTTPAEIVARYRVAGPRQLAAHTPRPRDAKGDLMNLQFHQSVANNLAEQLDLDGRRLTLGQLHDRLRGLLGGLLGGDDSQPLDKQIANVTIQFAARQAIRVRCEDGRAVLTIKLAELSQGRRRWYNFAIRAFYRPEIDGLSADLVRDGSVRLRGKRIHIRDQFALRGIFSKVLSPDRRLHIISKRLAENPRLGDVQVTRLVIADGWLGVALGPKQSPPEQRVATDPKTGPRG